MQSLNKAFLARDFTASLVVFLVAMPLCMGIAVASGLPPEKGLITGIVGGLVVGALAGSPLQVSGPAAGLAVIVFEAVQTYGLKALAPMLAVAGLVQFGAGALKLGGWFRAISPAVVQGMLAGIGALIVLGQLHTLFDAKPKANGVDNLMALPDRFLGLSDSGLDAAALGLGVLTIALMVGWDKLKPAALKLAPGALLGVVGATLTAKWLGLDVVRVNVPDSLASAITWPGADFLAPLANPAALATAFAIAFVASAETLLSAAAVDKMHDGPRTQYDKELRAQGVGNLLCGLLGALPMTGVIVRSSANVQAGAATRLSAMLHAAWILAFVALAPWLLREIPMTALGGVLVVTGWKLVSPSKAHALFRSHGLLPAAIWVVTFVTVVSTDLLTGVLAGIALSALELLPNIARLRLGVRSRDTAEGAHIRLHGVATFLALPKLNAVLDAVPQGKPVRLDLQRLRSMDHTVSEALKEWMLRHRSRGAEVALQANALQAAQLGA